MFKERFERLCFEKGMSPNAVCAEIGLSNSAYSKWTESSVPRASVLIKLSEYFGVSIAYLKGEEETHISVAPIEPLSEQEKTLIRIFRETTEEGRLEMIAAVMNIRRMQEKKPTATKTTTA